MNPRFLKQLDHSHIKHFFNSVRFKREQDQIQKKLSHSWESKQYKLYPSSIKSFTMCPYRFIQEDIHKPPSYPIPIVYSLEMGKYVHSMLQNEGLGIADLYWERPNYEGYMIHGIDLFEELVGKYKSIAPEVPVYDPKSGISGRADLILNIGGAPVVFDIKTTSFEDLKLKDESNDTDPQFISDLHLIGSISNAHDDYKKAFQRLEKHARLGVLLERERWIKRCEDLPSDDHKIQVGIYCHLINKYRLFKQPVRRAGLGYINLMLKPGDPAAEHEVYFDFTEEFEAQIALLIEHLGRERQRYLEGIESKCDYPLCRAHNLKHTIEAAKGRTNE